MGQISKTWFVLGAAGIATILTAQSPALRTNDTFGGPPYDRLEDLSWTHTPIVQRRVLDKHDIVQIRVDHAARTRSEDELERRKNSSYLAALTQWVRLDGFALKPAPQADGDPAVAGSTNQLYRAEGGIEQRESMTMSISATIVDVLPNQLLVLEAQQEFQTNGATWRYSLSGICRAEDVGPDNVVLSRNIHNLKVLTDRRGAASAGVRRGWMTRFVDFVNPF